MKNYLLIAVYLLSLQCAFTQTGTLKGVVTYYFNYNFGNKPDVGSSIMIMKVENQSQFISELNACNMKEVKAAMHPAELAYSNALSDYEARPKFSKAKTIKVLRDKKNITKKNLEKYLPDYEKAKKCEFDVYSKFFLQAKFVTETSVDGAGNYTLSIPTGRYFVSINSSHRAGRVVMYLDIKDNEVSEFSNNFGVNDPYTVFFNRSNY